MEALFKHYNETSKILGDDHVQCSLQSREIEEPHGLMTAETASKLVLIRLSIEGGDPNNFKGLSIFVSSTSPLHEELLKPLVSEPQAGRFHNWQGVLHL